MLNQELELSLNMAFARARERSSRLGGLVVSFISSIVLERSLGCRGKHGGPEGAHLASATPAIPLATPKLMIARGATRLRAAARHDRQITAGTRRRPQA